MNTTNPQPTQAAIECARHCSEVLRGRSLADETNQLAYQIDRLSNLPVLTAIALAAQGVVDAYAKPWGGGYVANDVGTSIETLASTLEKLNHTKP